MRATIYRVMNSKGICMGGYTTLAQARERATQCAKKNDVVTIKQVATESKGRKFSAFA